MRPRPVPSSSRRRAKKPRLIVRSSRRQLDETMAGCAKLQTEVDEGKAGCAKLQAELNDAKAGCAKAQDDLTAANARLTRRRRIWPKPRQPWRPLYRARKSNGYSASQVFAHRKLMGGRALPSTHAAIDQTLCQLAGRGGARGHSKLTPSVF